MIDKTTDADKGRPVSGLVSLLLRLGYYQVAAQCAGEGAQLVNGGWYMPRWGCDTLQNVLSEHGDEKAEAGTDDGRPISNRWLGLPRLPEPQRYFGHSTSSPMYTAEEMRAYGESVIRHFASDILTEIERLNDEGSCISLIYDDEGNYAIGTDGTQNVRLSDDSDLTITHFVDAALFRPTIREAWDAFVAANAAA